MKPEPTGPETDALPEAFLRGLAALEESYLTETDPILQSGFGGGAERWRAERGIILEAIPSDGDFLDIGCANGYLLTCLLAWGEERGVHLTPFGIDQGARLVALAKQRLPQYAPHFWVTNAWDWIPPRKFHYVYTLSEFVPPEFFSEYVKRLLSRYVMPGGRLILGSYGSGSRNEPARDVGAMLADLGYEVAGTAQCGWLPFTRIAWVEATGLCSLPRSQ